MKAKSLFFSVPVSLLLSGCWTVSETEFQTVNVTPVPAGKAIKVKLANYRTGVYNYVPVEGHESMDPSSGNTSGEEAKRQQASQVDRNASWDLQKTASGRLVSRSIAELERKGYTIDRENPDYVISLRFDGPRPYEHDVLRQVGYMLCTLFTAEKIETTWQAHLTVFNPDMTKALYEREFEQNYQATVWGPIPIASPACCEKVTERAADSWALTVLTDRAIEDATAFIAGQKK